MVSVYNMIAQLCSYIIKTCDEEFFIKFSCVAKSENVRMNTLLMTQLPELFCMPLAETDFHTLCAKPEIQPFSDEKIDEDFLKRLEVFSEKIIFDDDSHCIMRLIQDLDMAIRDVLQIVMERYSMQSSAQLLNTNKASTDVGIMPRCVGYWERKGRMRQNYNRIDNYLNHILLIDYSLLGNFQEKHIFLNKNLLARFKEDKTLHVAMTPFKNCRDLDASYFERDNIQYFKVEYYNRRVQEDNEEAWHKIQQAAEQQADIMVFPEMLGNATMQPYITEKLQQLDAHTRETIPSLIVLPSYWSDYNNEATILDKYGNIVCKQQKQYQYRIDLGKTGILEGIFPNRMIHIMHCEGIGRMAVLICKDFITTRYVEALIKCFKLTLILVPSYSTGSYDFKQALGLCAQNDCNVVWLNTCAAMQDGKEENFKNIGYVIKRISRQDDESERLYAMPHCEYYGKAICDRHCLYVNQMRGV